MSQSLPIVVILGRPNVGKSRLFNRLTGTRRSIVTDEPGITRDRIHGTAEWQGRAFEVVDTGGLVPDETAAMPREVMRQAKVAIDSAAVLVLVVDARAGLLPLDAELARLARTTGKPLVIAANKVDTAGQESLTAPFFALGPNVFGVSAEHGTGLDALLDHITRDFSEAPLEPEPEPAIAEPRDVQIAIIGRPNVGKSTLLNQLTGSDRAIVSPEPGTTRDAVDAIFERGGHRYHFVDTAGIRRKSKTKMVAEKMSVMMARRHLEEADIALLVADASVGVTAGDLTIAGYAQQSGRSVILVLNKWDLAVEAARAKAAEVKAAPENKAARNKSAKKSSYARAAVKPPAPAFSPEALATEYEQLVRTRFKFLDYAPVIFLSALTGQRVAPIFDLMDRVAAARRRRISTGELNRWLKETDLDRGTTPSARRVKIYYMTQASTSPPTFVIFTNQAKRLHFSFERFLENRLRESFDFLGTPIRFLQRVKERKEGNDRGERKDRKDRKDRNDRLERR
ncbi:MAG: ribosome biogenesis GTPase Der [Candidatus Acidiferrales bacterium]|jgi:GTP-binding protein